MLGTVALNYQGRGATYRSHYLFGAISVENLTSPKLYADAVPYHPVYSGFVELRGLGAYSLTAAVTLEKTEIPRYGVGQMVDVTTYGSIFWGLSTSPLQFGGGLQVKQLGGRISYAVSYHPTLGISYTAALAYAFGGRR